MPDDDRDMLAHDLDQSLAGARCAVLVHEDPLRSLRMPDERVPRDEHAVALREIHKLVGRREHVHAGLRVDALKLHDVLRRDGVEIRLDDACIIGSIVGVVVGVCRHSDPEGRLVCLGKRLGSRKERSWNACGQGEGDRCEAVHVNLE